MAEHLGTFFILMPAPIWGDYGDVLVSGFFHRSSPDGPALLRRTGPFLPPICFPYCTPHRICIVSDSMKRAWESRGLHAGTFRHAILNKITRIEWQEWDFATDLPKIRPNGGEPENYLDDDSETKAISQLMETPWESLPEKHPIVFGDSLHSKWREGASAGEILLAERCAPRGLFTSEFGALIADQETANWLNSTVGDWIELQPVKAVHDTTALARLSAQGQYYAKTGADWTAKEYLASVLALCERNGYIVPPALHRPDSSASRYCVVLFDEPRPKLSAITYSSLEDLASYLERRTKTVQRTSEAKANLKIHDLETGRELKYLGNGDFTANAQTRSGVDEI